MSGEINLAKQWLAKSKNDLLNADNNLVAQDVPCDTVCFHCQQAAEKMLKAYLIAHAQPYPISHDLLLILEHIMPLEPQAENLRPLLALLNPYAVTGTTISPGIGDSLVLLGKDRTLKRIDDTLEYLKRI